MGIAGQQTSFVAQQTSCVARYGLLSPAFPDLPAICRATAAGVGVFVGLGVVWGVTRLLTSLRFEVRPVDPLTCLLAVSLLLAVTLLASCLPARRVTRIDPIQVLRASEPAGSLVLAAGGRTCTFHLTRRSFHQEVLMSLSVRALAIVGAVLMGGCMLLVGIANLIFPAYGGAFLDLMASVYPGYHGPAGFGSVIVATLYGGVDGAICGAILAWLYNLADGETIR